MLKKLFKGLFYGAGFAIAIMFVFVVYALNYTGGRDGVAARSVVPVEIPVIRIIDRPRQAATEDSKYRYYNTLIDRWTVPEKGGVLLVVIDASSKTNGRPDSMQIWLTGKQAWLIRTRSEDAQKQVLPYPGVQAVATMRYLLEVKTPKNRGVSGQRVFRATIDEIRRSGKSDRGLRIGGDLRGGTDGVVYLIPFKQ